MFSYSSLVKVQNLAIDARQEQLAGANYSSPGSVDPPSRYALRTGTAVWALLARQLVDRAGLEPATSSLQMKCSTR